MTLYETCPGGRTGIDPAVCGPTCLVCGADLSRVTLDTIGATHDRAVAVGMTAATAEIENLHVQISALRALLAATVAQATRRERLLVREALQSDSLRYIDTERAVNTVIDRVNFRDPPVGR